MRPESFQITFGANDEALEKLHLYHELLEKWQSAINLVSSKTLREVWSRHFADSAQILEYLPPAAGHDKKTRVADLGTGAGFPGIVMAIMRSDLDVHLIESDQRKAEFLKTVSRETGTAVHVHADRIENITGKISPDLAVARALAPLGDLLDFCAPWARANAAFEMIFLKGSRALIECEEASARHDFTLRDFPSRTDPAGRILCIRNLRF